jgi:hypothetical protein
MASEGLFGDVGDLTISTADVAEYAAMVWSLALDPARDQLPRLLATNFAHESDSKPSL